MGGWGMINGRVLGLERLCACGVCLLLLCDAAVTQHVSSSDHQGTIDNPKEKGAGFGFMFVMSCVFWGVCVASQARGCLGRFGTRNSELRLRAQSQGHTRGVEKKPAHWRCGWVGREHQSAHFLFSLFLKIILWLKKK